MTDLDHALERTITIRATRSTVFAFFTDSERFARWWGVGSHIDPHPGGAVRICYPGGVVATGEVVELVDRERVVFTYGYEDEGKPIRPGGSRVTITLEEHVSGTRLHLRHEFADAATRDAHVPGWRYQLAVFANVAADAQHADAASLVDRFLAAWSETDGAVRREVLEATTTPEVTFRDAFGCTTGREELDAHIGAVQMHVPGVVLERDGEVRHCQGTALVDWVARGSAGERGERNRGTNVFDLAPDGRIAAAVGIGGRG